MTPITDTPNEFRRILDDTEAKFFLIQFGLIDKLLEHGTPPRKSFRPWSSALYRPPDPLDCGRLLVRFHQPSRQWVRLIPKSQVQS